MLRAPEISGAGTGKGLLVRSICAIAFGVQPRAFTRGGDRQELDKRLASELIEAAPILFLDNVNGTMLRSDTLASVLTERPARVRPLGRTQMVALNSTAFIALTGNVLSLSEDLARRFIVCEFDAQCEDPEQRKFASGLLDDIGRCRAELLAAALTIWRWGRQNPADIGHGRPFGSFEQWSEWCRDPLLALGCRDPIDRIDEIKSDDPARSPWGLRSTHRLGLPRHSCHGCLVQLRGRDARRDDEYLSEPLRRAGRDGDDRHPPRKLARQRAGAKGVMSGRPSHLVQILLPKETGGGEPVSKQWFDTLLKELTDRFDGATSFLRSPGEGLWQNGGEKERDSIAVIEGDGRGNRHSLLAFAARAS